MCSFFNIHQFKESCLNGRLVSMACSPSGSRRNLYRNCKNWPLLEHEILRVQKQYGDRVCVGGVSRPVGWACRPRGFCVGRRGAVPDGGDCIGRPLLCRTAGGALGAATKQEKKNAELT